MNDNESRDLVLNMKLNQYSEFGTNLKWVESQPDISQKFEFKKPQNIIKSDPSQSRNANNGAKFSYFTYYGVGYNRLTSKLAGIKIFYIFFV